jgi:MFS family permease
MVTSIGAGTVADVTEPAKRASRIGLFLLGPQLGPLLGPLIGGQFSHENRWRWVFGFLCKQSSPLVDMSILLTHYSRSLYSSIPAHLVLSPRDPTLLGGQWECIRKL